MNRAAQVFLVVLAIALLSRLYGLSEYPFFSSDKTYVGVSWGDFYGLHIDETDFASFKGLYVDEYQLYIYAKNLVLLPPMYEPWLQLAAMKLSLLVLGDNQFAIRLPSAIFSVLSIALVYWICIEKFKSTVAALLSSLFLVVMSPAFMYNRMAFLENGVAFFFLLTYFSLLKYRDKQEGKYIVLSMVFAGLCVLCKINGLVVPLFLLLYLSYYHLLLKNLKLLIFPVALILSFPIMISILYNESLFNVAVILLDAYGFGGIGGVFTIQQFLTLQSLPSGHILSIGSQEMLEFWYILPYIALIFISVREIGKVSDILLGLFSFIGLFYLVGGISAYYVTIILPFMAIPMGYYLIWLGKLFGGILHWTG